MMTSTSGRKILYGELPQLEFSFVDKLAYGAFLNIDFCTNVYKILVITTTANIIANAENMTALPNCAYMLVIR